MSETNSPALARALAPYLAAATSVSPPGLPLAAARQLARAQGCSLREVELAALAIGLLPERYRRNFGTLGLAGQARLLRATVGVVGAGGLGGWIIEALARMGVGRLIVIDGDTFQENNLNRQLGCTEATLGRAKAVVLAERASVVNSAVEVVAQVAWLTAENAGALLGGAEVLVDALDTLPARFVLEDAARALGVPLVHGAIGGYTGQVMTIFPGDPGLRGFYGDNAPERGVEVRLGNPAATPMMVAAWQVQEVIKLLTGQGALLRGRILLMDAAYGEVSEIQLGTGER